VTGRTVGGRDAGGVVGSGDGGTTVFGAVQDATIRTSAAARRT
jgi:hypothetical protein